MTSPTAAALFWCLRSGRRSTGVHPVEDAAVDRLQAVARVRESRAVMTDIA